MHNLFEIYHKYFHECEVRAVFDLGSRNAEESITLSKKYPNAIIYAFECNPAAVKDCHANIEKHEKIVLIPKAVNNYDGTCTFYPIDRERTSTVHKDGNIGASSLFKASGAYDHIEKYVQYQIEVQCTRIDSFIEEYRLSPPDIVWMDLQGAALLALESFGDYLESVRLIHTEVEMNPIYENQSTYEEIDKYLRKQKFILCNGNLNKRYGTDLIYVNSKYLNIARQIIVKATTFYLRVLSRKILI